MGPIEEYRGQASECRRHAEDAQDPTEKSVWLLLENAWIRLSDDAPNMLKEAVVLEQSPRIRQRKRRKRRR